MNNLELADKLQATAAQHYGDLCGMLWDGGAALRKLHTENTALRVTEENLLAEIEKVRNDAERWRELSYRWTELCAEFENAPDVAPLAMKGKE